MPASDLPADVRSLLDSTITSVEQLELLLLLHREPGRAWTAIAAGRAVHTSEHSAGIRLAELAARGVARETPEGFVLADDRELGQAVRVLERLYATHRVKIISRIFAKPPDAVRDFADAFRLRRKGDR